MTRILLAQRCVTNTTPRPLHKLSYSSQHLKKVIFIGSLGTLVPLMFMSLESLGCIMEVPGLLDIKRLPNPTKKDRFNDIVWER